VSAGELSVKITADLTDIKGKLAELEAKVQQSLGKTVPEAGEKAGTGMRAMGKVLREVTPLLGAEASGIARHLAGIGNAVDLLLNRSQALSLELRTGLAVAVAAAGYNLGVWLGEKAVNAIDDVDALTEKMKAYNKAVKESTANIRGYNDAMTALSKAQGGYRFLRDIGESDIDLLTKSLSDLKDAGAKADEELRGIEERIGKLKEKVWIPPVMGPRPQAYLYDKENRNTVEIEPGRLEDNPALSKARQDLVEIKKGYDDLVVSIKAVTAELERQKKIASGTAEKQKEDLKEQSELQKQFYEDLQKDYAESVKAEEKVGIDRADALGKLWARIRKEQSGIGTVDTEAYDLQKKIMQDLMKDEQKSLDEKIKHERELQAEKLRTGSVAARVAALDRQRWAQFSHWVDSLQFSTAKLLGGIQNIANTVSSSIGQALSAIIVYGEDATEVLDALWKGLLANIIQYFVQLLLEQLMFFIASKILGVTYAEGQLLLSAGRGAAGAMASVYENYPWPASIAIAAAAGPEALAQILAASEPAAAAGAALAEGGIVLGPTLALIGERDTEVVLPLDRLDSYLSRKSGDITFITEIDGKALTRAVVPNIPGVLRSRGIRGI
jgi:hypothetical protein